MKNLFKSIVCLAIILTFVSQAVWVEAGSQKVSTKPTEGIQSSNENYGTSTNSGSISKASVTVLLSSWSCSITNTGTNLYLDCNSTATSIISSLNTTLYLQRWTGTAWVNVISWSYSSTNCKSLTNGDFSSYTTGTYYRARSVHYAINGTQSENQSTVSSYIYIE